MYVKIGAKILVKILWGYAGFMHDKEDESKDGFCDVTDYLIGRKISNLSKEQFLKSIFGF